ncbi:hypothetical protein M413DRAFT_156319 [Hebeloma cylindrosporum]|uniref:Uncharacterized protein n=1 Tax=Hebeloma cylindrosporum TaxID=76867 RepID=A0A0C3CBE0_HEBCY|nr:hypothetical protein M413DRAFT_156319 [Hebeloma cylindrosporum h7]
MFSWRRTKKSSSYEPKTPKMTNISLPDERYVVPPSIYRSYTEKPHKHDSYSRDFIPNKRASTPLVQPNTYHHDAPSMRSRPRTVSTPVREVEAPRPIRPHPSQGPFLPNHRDRIDPSHLTLAPVGVPSAAFLEEQLRRQRTETRTAPQAHSNMSELRHPPFFFGSS